MHGRYRDADPPRQRRALYGTSHRESGGECGPRDLSRHVLEALPTVGDGAEGEKARLAVEIGEASVLEDRPNLWRRKQS